MFRIGYGTDIHRLEKGLDLFLGGIRIPSEYGGKAHSDGDVILHALCDSLLGALSLGDIGEMFPDSDPAYRGMASSIFLDQIVSKVKETGYSIGNVDITLHLETPKISSYKNSIRQQLATLLGLDKDSISLKAKTSEGMGPVGRGEAIQAEVVVLLHS